MRQKPEGKNDPLGKIDKLDCIFQGPTSRGVLDPGSCPLLPGLKASQIRLSLFLPVGWLVSHAGHRSFVLNIFVGCSRLLVICCCWLFVGWQQPFTCWLHAAAAASSPPRFPWGAEKVPIKLTSPAIFHLHCQPHHHQDHHLHDHHHRKVRRWSRRWPASTTARRWSARKQVKFFF